MKQNIEGTGIYNECAELKKDPKTEIKKILYRNSEDDSYCMRIRFEDIDKVVDLIYDFYNTH